MPGSDFQLDLESKRLLAGYSGGLGEKTALIELVVSGVPGCSAAVEQRLRHSALALCPEQRLFDIVESDWPTTFLNPPGPVDPDVGWLGSWVVAFTVAIQRFGRDPVRRGRVVQAQPDRMSLAVPWRRDAFFSEALDFAIELVRAGVSGQSPATVAGHFGQNWPAIVANGMVPNRFRLIEAAMSRDIPVSVLPNFIQLGWGANAERFDGSFTGRTSWIADTLAHDKWNSKRTLARAEVVVPHAWVVHNLTDAQYVAANLTGWPVVVKPLNRVSDGSDNGVTTGIPDPDTLCAGFERAARFSNGGVIVEEHIDGDDHRLLVVNGRFLAAARRKVAVGEPPFGTVDDVTADVHPDNQALVERVARVIGLDIAGVDVLTTDIDRPWHEVGGVVYGVCGQPDFSPHEMVDPDRDLTGEVLDSVFAGRPVRIPTAAITGTNGKTTTSEMLFNIWTAAGKLTGVCTTVAVRIGKQRVSTKNLSGWPGARIILEDPGVEATVFEMPRKGLLKFGHPCDRYDVAALLNVQNDHIGDEGIDTLEQMAELKAEVLARASLAVVINADDPLCLAVRPRAGTERHILVGSPDNPAIHEHRRAGGEALFVADRDANPCIILVTGDREQTLMPVREIPAAMNGMLPFNISNAMFAAALAWAQGIAPEAIRRGLGAFSNSQDTNPGRYNFIEGFPAQVLFDYAHNADGFRQMCSVVGRMPVTGRRILYSRGLGNHSAAQFAEVAPLMAAYFDEFVISCGERFVSVCPDYEGPDPVAAMLSMSAARLRDAGVPADMITTTGDRTDGIGAALGRGRTGDLVVLLDDPNAAFPVIDGLRRPRS